MHAQTAGNGIANNMKRQFNTARLLFAATLFVLALPAIAKESADWRSWPMGDRFVISIGVFFPNIDTRISASSASNPVGAKIDFERDLGMDDSVTRPLGSFAWRFAKNHRLVVNYFNLNRSGDVISKAQITIGDLVIEAGVPVQSFLDIAVIEGAYTYSLVYTEKVEWSVGLGLSFQDVDVGILADDGQIIQSQDVSLALPLPTINTTLGYAFTDNLIGRLKLGWLAVEADVSDSTDFEGSIWNGSVGMRYKAFKNVGFDFGWSYFQVDVDYFKRDLIGELDYRYHGPLVAIEWVF
jgi:hypothetical protein